MNPLHISAILACATAAACSGSSSGSSSSAGVAPQPTLHGDWSCTSVSAVPVQPFAHAAPLVEVTPPPPVGGSAFSVYLTEAYAGQGLPDLYVTACPALDANCASPVAHAWSDEYGLATLSVRGGLQSFGGYLKISAPAMPDNYVFLARRQPTYGSNALTVAVYTQAAVALTYEWLGVSFDAQHGIVRTDVSDCIGTSASGVALDFEASQASGIVTGYVTGSGAVVSVKAAATDVNGAAFAFDVLPGPIGVVGTLDGVPIGDATGFVHPGAVTSLAIRPTGVVVPAD